MSTDLIPRLVPPPTKGHVSVAKLTDYWYVGCFSRDLKRKPIARTVLGIPMVFFRAEGKAGALLDRCPHRNVPLSVGKVHGGTLECGYHGWRFDHGGACVAVPGLCAGAEARGRKATAYPIVESQGMVWVWANADKDPVGEPPKLPGVDEPGYTTQLAEFTIEATLHATLENILDVPHTAFLHGGLFRTAKKRNEITAIVNRDNDKAVAQYVGEPRPTGLVGKLLAPGGGEVEHYDRFLMPSIAQVEYKLGERSHIIGTQALTPVGDFETRAYIIITYKLPIPHWVLRPFVEPVMRKILKQDAYMLKLQTDNIRRFGGERYTSTEIDVLGPHIWQLLKNAERGEEPTQHENLEIRLRV